MYSSPRSVRVVSVVAIVLLVSERNETHALDKVEKERALQETESQLRAIYERNQFRSRGFRAQWLPDSSGYTVQEWSRRRRERVNVRYDVESGERSVKAPPPRRRPRDVSPDGKKRLDRRGPNIFVQDLAGGERVPLTRSPADGAISNRQAVWSPDGKRIAFVQSDSSGVRERSVLVPGDPSYPTVREVRFARVGGTIATLRVGVGDAEGKSTRWVSMSSPNDGFYLGQVDWAGNSNELLVEKLSRFRDEREFLLADVRTGETRRIFHETDPAWVVASYRKNSGLKWIRGGEAFLVLSEQDGWRHAYVYSRAGKKLSLLTPGSFDIIERSVIDEEGGWFYYYASPDNGTQKYLYRVALDGKSQPERLTPNDQPGTHDYEFSPDAKWAFHTWSTFDTPPQTELVQLSPEYKVVRALSDNRELQDRLKSLSTRPTEFLTLKIEGGVEMDAWMIRPLEFDASKKYPVFVHVYGEPHGQTVLDAWGRSHALFHRAIANLGYLVVSIDNRGTPAPKGAAWRRSIFGSLGPLSTEEQAAAIQALGRKHPFVDLSRVGIWGWSGGGSNTLNAMFRKPDVYKVGIAVAPKPQPHLYNAWFQEIYMNTPEVNAEGYRRSAPINFAEGLKGDLLIVHGTGETNTHLQITEGLVDRLIELGKHFDYMAYPHRDHGLREGKGTAVHLRMLMARYLLEHLPPGPK